MVAKNIRLGNEEEYNLDIGGMELVQSVEIHYTAELETSTFDLDVYKVVTVITPLTIGEDNAVEVWRNGGSDTCILRLKADEGYRFNTFTPKVTGDNPIQMPTLVIEYELTDNEVSYYKNTLGYLVTTEGGTPPTPEPPTGIKTENNYLLTLEQFETFKDELYSIVEGETISSDVQNPAKFPSNKFVSSSKLYPFLVPQEEQGNATNIIVKKSVLEVQGIRIIGSVITIDIGDIEITNIYNNALDYVNTTIDLYMPYYLDSVQLDADLVMGKTINIKYEVIIVTGETTINITDSSTGVILYSFKNTIGGEFPLFNRTELDYTMFSPTQTINNMRQAYVLVSIPDYSGVSPKAERKGVLIDELGEVKVSDIDLVTSAYAEEKQMIESLLSQGVIIK